MPVEIVMLPDEEYFIIVEAEEKMDTIRSLEQGEPNDIDKVLVHTVDIKSVEFQKSTATIICWDRQYVFKGQIANELSDFFTARNIGKYES